MKLISKDFVPNGPGTVKLIPEEADDLWLAYKLISQGDLVSAETTRKVQSVTGGGKGTGAVRVKLKLEIKVLSREYDKEASILRIRGKTISAANGNVAAGVFHTLEIEQHQVFELTKKVWDSTALTALQKGSDHAAGRAELAVILLQQGLAHLFLVGSSVTTLAARIEDSAPRKNGPAGSTKTALSKFFVNVLQAFTKYVDFGAVRCAVIAGPGSVKDQFHRYLISEAQRLQLKSIVDNKSRLVVVGTSSGNKHSLKEVLDSPSVKSLIKDTKVAEDIRVFKNFSEMLSSNTDRACYGPKNVEVAHGLTAVQTLLITDDLFRSSDVATRQKYADLVESVEKVGGTAHVFSSMYGSGEQLAQLTGIAAILRFPLPDLDDMEL